MKTLKITFLLLAVLLLTVSGQSIESVSNSDGPVYKQQNTQNLLAIDKKKLKLETQG